MKINPSNIVFDNAFFPATCQVPKPIYIYIYIYQTNGTVFVSVTTKSAQHAHARMIAIIVEKVHTQVICTTMVSWI